MNYEASYYKAAALKQRPPYLPSRVRVLHRCRADFPFVGAVVEPGEHDCHSNPYGAVSVTASNGKPLGLRLEEFEPLDWVLNPEAC